MAIDKEEGQVVLLHDMNSNELREGDLVIVLLEKPILVGFISKIEEPSILTKEKRPGIITITGATKLMFIPRQPQYLQNVAKLVNPHAESFVNAIADKIRQGADASVHKKENETEGPKANGPTLVTGTHAAVAAPDVSPSSDS